MPINIAQDTPYQEFFRAKLKKFGVDSPSELSEADKKDFFNEVELDWKKEQSK